MESILTQAQAGMEVTEQGCWLPTCWTPQPKGYIRVASPVDYGATHVLLHRLAWEAEHGVSLGPEDTVDHLCHNRDRECLGGPSCPHRRCFNPAHLERVDAVTNWERGRLGVVADRRAKTHCPNNHPYTGNNLRPNKTGARACQACHRARAAGRPPALEPAFV